MAEDLTATFALELDGTQAAHGAKSAADALQTMRDQLAGGIDELRGMNAALRNLKGSAGTSGDAIQQLKARIAAQKATIAENQQAIIKLGGGFKQVKAPAQGATGALGGFLARARDARGPLGSLTGAIGELSTLTRGAVIAAGIIGITAALVALGAAAVATAGSLALYALRQADARRSELLQLEGLTKIRSYLFGLGGGYARAADSAEFLQGTIDKISGGVAIGRERVAQYASQLYKMGLRAGNLQDALEGVAITAATQGEGQASIFASWAAGAAMTGQSVKALANDVKARLGGIAKAQLLSLDVQARKLHENISMLFSGLKIDKILGSVATLTELFSQSTASGRALKSIVSAVGNSMAGMFDGPALLAKRFFQGMIIGALHLTIGFLKVRNALRDAFGNSTFLRGMTLQKIAVGAGMVAAFGLAAALGAVALALGAIAVGVTVLLAFKAATLAAGAALFLLTSPIGLAISAVAALGYAAYKIFSADNWAQAAKNLVLGLVNGIKNGVGAFVGAIKDLAAKGMTAFKNAFGIHSPSSVMDRYATQIVAGNVRGVRRETPRATFAMQHLAYSQQGGFMSAAAEPTITPRAPAAPAARAPLIGVLNLAVNGASGATQDIKEAVIEAMNQVFDAARIQAAQPLRAGASA